MNSLKWIVLGIVFAVFCVPSNGQGKADWASLYEPYPNEGMPYRLMKPLGFDASISYPVIVSLHGGGGKGTNNNKQLKDWNKQLAEASTRKKHPAYVLAPQAEGLWDGEHLKKIKAIIAALPSVDMNRIYIMGHSMGGHGTFILLQIDPNYFAGAGPSAGTGLKTTKPFIDAKIIKDIPIWAFHGSKDGVCPYPRDVELLAEMKKLNGNMKLTTWEGDNHGVSGKMIPGADNGSTETSGDRCNDEPDFLTWLFEQKRAVGK